MLLYSKNTLKQGLKQTEKEAEFYQARFTLHQRNACARVKDTGLIYEAIQLAQQKDFIRWAWRHDLAENHPAILKLCAFWECFQEGKTDQPIRTARIPYIHRTYALTEIC